MVPPGVRLCKLILLQVPGDKKMVSELGLGDGRMDVGSQAWAGECSLAREGSEHDKPEGAGVRGRILHPVTLTAFIKCLAWV